jgi:hypothetical protein
MRLIPLLGAAALTGMFWIAQPTPVAQASVLASLAAPGLHGVVAKDEDKDKEKKCPVPPCGPKEEKKCPTPPCGPKDKD